MGDVARLRKLLRWGHFFYLPSDLFHLFTLSFVFCRLGILSRIRGAPYGCRCRSYLRGACREAEKGGDQSAGSLYRLILYPVGRLPPIEPGDFLDALQHHDE